MLRFTVISQTLAGQVFDLDGEYITIGRATVNTLRLDHPGVSKQHAMVTVDKGDVKLWDLHSTNGVFVNGQKAVLHHLQPGDRIRLGEVELLFTTPVSAQNKKETKPIQISTTAPASH